MKALKHFNHAVELEKLGEDGSGYLALVCGSFEFAQLHTTIAADHEYRYLLNDAIKINFVTNK